MVETWDFSDLTGKSEKKIDDIKKEVNNSTVLENDIKNESKNNDISLTQEVQLSMQIESKRPITITLDESLIKIIDEKAAKIITTNNQGSRSKIINAALTRLFK